MNNPHKTGPGALSLGTYWAIEEGYAFAALDLLQGVDFAAAASRFEAGTATDEHDGQPSSIVQSVRSSGSSDRKPYGMLSGGIAVIEMSGPMTKRTTCASWMLGGASTQDTRRQVRTALQDADVLGVAFIIDSPGGTVSGTKDLADDVAALAAAKPVYVYAEDQMCSAAYWVGSQGTKIYAGETSIVGSLGTYMSVADYSGWAKKEGIKPIVIRAGAMKGAGTIGTEITDEMVSHWQAMIDALNSQFMGSVQTGRGMDEKQVAKLNDGRVHTNQDALDLGLVDKVGSLDSMLADLEAHLAEKMDDPTLSQSRDQSQSQNQSRSRTHTAGPQSTGTEHSQAGTPDTSTEEKPKTMSLKDQIKAFLTAQNVSPETTEAVNAIDEAAAADLAQIAAAHQVELSKKETEIQQLRAAQAARDQEADARAKEFTAAETAAKIEELKAAFKLMPAAEEHALKLRAADPVAFDALFATIEPNSALAGGAAKKTAAGKTVKGETAAARTTGSDADNATLTEMATEYAKENKISFSAALRIVSDQNPELVS